MPAVLFLILQEARVVTVAPVSFAEARAAVEEYFGIADAVVPVRSADERFTIEDPFGESGAVVVVTDEKERVAVGDSKRWYRPRLEVVDWAGGDGLYRVRNGSDAATEPLRLGFHAFGKERFVTGLVALETDGEALEPVRLGGAEFKPEMVVRRADGTACVFGRFTAATAEAATGAEVLSVGDRTIALATLAPQGVSRGGDAPALTSRGAVREGDEAEVEMSADIQAVAIRNDIPWPLLSAVAYEITDGGKRELIRTRKPQDRASVRAGEAGSTLKFAATYEADWERAVPLREEAARAIAAIAEREPALAYLLPQADAYYQKR